MGCSYTPLRWARHGKAAHLPGRDHFGLPYRSSSLQTWETLKNNAAIYINQSSLRGATQLYPCSHSMRPCLMTFWYQPPCHFCHSPVYCRSWQVPRSCWELCEPHARRRLWGCCFNLGRCSGNRARPLALARRRQSVQPFFWLGFGPWSMSGVLQHHELPHGRHLHESSKLWWGFLSKYSMYSSSE